MNLALGKPTQTFKRHSGELNSIIGRRGPFASVQDSGIYEGKRYSEA